MIRHFLIIRSHCIIFQEPQKWHRVLPGTSYQEARDDISSLLPGPGSLMLRHLWGDQGIGGGVHEEDLVNIVWESASRDRGRWHFLGPEQGQSLIQLSHFPVSLS